MNNSGWLLLVVALMLGIRHGFDLDHLATIDSITRTVCNKNHFSRLVGFLFSLGHGLVVISISLLMASGLLQSHVPQWLDVVGSGISIFFLFVFGISNLRNSLQKSSDKVASVGLKSFFVRKIIHENISPAEIVIIGALFALSFDTFSQVALFSLSGSLIAGGLFSALLGFMFMSGMMISDGLNGLLVSVLIQQANRLSRFLSSMAGVTIAMFSLIIGFENLIKMV